MDRHRLFQQEQQVFQQELLGLLGLELFLRLAS
jgi:hypothetical protein